MSAISTVDAIEPPVDPGVRRILEILMREGVETFESCEGGTGHSFAETTVRFHGDRAEGFRAFSIASRAGLAVAELRRIWVVQDGEPAGPWWEMTFSRTEAGER